MIKVGPWVGEFGWEIMHFVPAARLACCGHEEVLVACQIGSQALYEFGTTFMVFPNVYESCCARGVSKRAEQIVQEFRREGGEWFQARLNVGKKKYVRYGRRGHPDYQFDLVIHARETKKQRFGKSSLARNWPQGKWNNVLEKLKGVRIAAIGLVEESWCPPCADDFRGLSLYATMDLLASSKLIAGPQSGPIHLAALCECPAVVWTRRNIGPGKRKNQARLTELWNPFRTPVTILDGFDIGPEPVVDAIWKNLECARSTLSSDT